MPAALQRQSAGIALVAVGLLATAGAVFAAHPKRATLYEGRTAQGEALTGPGGNHVAFRVSANGRTMAFRGRVNLSGDHCVDTLSDRANSKKGIGHEAPAIVVHKNGRFAGSGTLKFPGGSDHTKISGHAVAGGRKLVGTIRETEPPNSRLPQGCRIKTKFTASAA